MKLIDFFDKAVSETPDRPFLVDASGVRTYREVAPVTHRVANALLSLGVHAGARVAVLSENSPLAFECVLGVIRAGCVYVPISPRNTASEIATIAESAGVELLLHSSEQRALAEAVRDGAMAIRQLVCIDGQGERSVALVDLLRDQPSLAPDTRSGHDDAVVILTSGGTTGTPKCVVTTNAGWAAKIATTVCVNAMGEPLVHLVVAPMTHAAGNIALMLMALSATNVVLPRFEPETVLQAIERHRVTHLFLPPTAIYRLLSHPGVRERDYSSLRQFTYSAAPMAPAKVVEAMEVFGPVMCTAFGQTETGPLNTYFSPQEHLRAVSDGDERRMLSCGRPTPFTRVEIMDEEGQLLGPNQRGELVVRSTQLMKGYINAPDEMAAVSRFGWHHTGDVGYKDDEGWIYLVDRKRELIISGGFNVFPAEVERVVLQHPSIQDCAVIGRPDDDWGEVVVAVVEVKRGLALDIDELRSFCRSRLSGVKAPKVFAVWDELPRSAAGKVLRRKIRDQFWHDRARAV